MDAQFEFKENRRSQLILTLVKNVGFAVELEGRFFYEVKAIMTLHQNLKYTSAIEFLLGLNKKLENENLKAKTLSEQYEQISLDALYVLLSQINHLLGDIHMDMSNATTAQSFYIKALNFLKYPFNQGSQNQVPKKNEREAAYLLVKLGKTWLYTCDYPRVLKVLNKALEVLRGLSLEDSPEYAFALMQLGIYYRFMFQDQISFNMLNSSLEINEKNFGKVSEEVADTLHSKAHLFLDMGRSKDALEVINTCLNVRLELLGPKNPKVARSLYLLGNIHLKREEYSQAEEKIQKALEINQSVMGDNYLETAECYHSLGRIQSCLKSREFITYFSKSLIILGKIYGSNHTSIAVLLNHFGSAYYSVQEYELAAECFSESICIYRVICGDKHLNMAITLKNSGDCNKQLKRFKTANICYQECYRIYRETYGENHSIVKDISKCIIETETEE